jgi:hypothetical protein
MWVGFFRGCGLVDNECFSRVGNGFQGIDRMVFKGLDSFSGCWGSSGGFSSDWQRFSKDLRMFSGLQVFKDNLF